MTVYVLVESVYEDAYNVGVYARIGDARHVARAQQGKARKRHETVPLYSIEPWGILQSATAEPVDCPVEVIA